MLPSTASESPGKTKHESQSPLSMQTEKYDRTVTPVVCAHSSSYSEWNVDKLGLLKSGNLMELMDDRTVRPIVCPQRGAPQHFVIEDDEAESDVSIGSRSFLRRVNDQVRKRQKQSSKDATEDSEEHSVKR